jgi:hypothetical protein
MNAIAKLDKGMAPKPMMALIPSTHGEKKALAPTKDGMREKRNRRGGYLPIGRFSELVTIEGKRVRSRGGGSGLNFRLMSHASFFCAVAALAFLFTIVRLFAGIICLMLQVTLIGWVPTATWAIYALSQYNMYKRLDGLDGA